MKQLLKSRGIKQIFLAETLGVSEATVSSWVNRRARVPAERVADLARATGIDPSEWRPDLFAKMTEAAR